MNVPVSLTDLIDALEMPGDEAGMWLDRQTGRVLMIEEDLRNAVEEAADDEEEPDGVEDWQKELLPVARGIAAGDPRYLALPDKFDFHEYRHMERFIGTIPDEGMAGELWRAIKGKGAFRYFKDTADRLGLLERWYDYRDEAMKRFMLDWAAAHEVEVNETPGHTDP